MENQKNTDLQTKPKTSWSNIDREKLLLELTVVIAGQNTYGKEYNLADTMLFFEKKLSRFPVDMVLAAIDKFTDRNDNVPTPADIIKILEPEKPKITTAEYVHAQKQHAAEGYPAIGYYGEIIREYEAQQEQGREQEGEIQCQKVKQLVSNSMKKIGS